MQLMLNRNRITHHRAEDLYFYICLPFKIVCGIIDCFCPVFFIMFTFYVHIHIERSKINEHIQ